MLRTCSRIGPPYSSVLYSSLRRSSSLLSSALYCALPEVSSANANRLATRRQRVKRYMTWAARSCSVQARTHRMQGQLRTTVSGHEQLQHLCHNTCSGADRMHPRCTAAHVPTPDHSQGFTSFPLFAWQQARQKTKQESQFSCQRTSEASGPCRPCRSL